MKFICRPASVDIYDIYIEYLKKKQKTKTKKKQKKQKECDVNTERSETCSTGFSEACSMRVYFCT